MRLKLELKGIIIIISFGASFSLFQCLQPVAARWRAGVFGEKSTLMRCYENSLALAEKYAVKTIAFPAIATGGLFFPVEAAARIAITEVMQFLLESKSIEKVLLVCFKVSIQLLAFERNNLLRLSDNLFLLRGMRKQTYFTPWRLRCNNELITHS